MPHQRVGDGAEAADVNEQGRGRETAAQLASRVLLQYEVWNEIVHVNLYMPKLPGSFELPGS